MNYLNNNNNLLKQESSDFNISYYFLVCLFSIILFYLGVFTRFTTDYYAHTKSMEKLSISPLLNPLNWANYFSTKGYPLWFICGKVIKRVFSCPSNYAAGICTGSFLVISYIGVLVFYNYKFEKKANNNLIALLAFILFIVGPVWLPWQNKYIIIGNGGPNVWHNATNICGRAIGIYAFYYSMKLLDIIIDSNYEKTPKLKQWILLSLVYCLSLLAKPSFAQSFVPSFGILLIFFLVLGRKKFVIPFLCFLGTAILPLLRLAQMSFFYFGEEGIYTNTTGEKFLIIIPSMINIIKIVKMQILIFLFPIVISTIMIFKKKINRYHILLFMMLAFSIFYVLAFKGSAMGEMGWAYYIAAFFVFLLSIHDYIYLFFFRKINNNFKLIEVLLFVISTIILLEHFAVGLWKLFQLIVKGNVTF